MITVRPSNERGAADHGWLKSQHSFSFANFYDPRHMGFGPLRVINQDWVAPGAGFPTHPHRDMEILSYVLEGALAHKDSMGNGSTIRPGDVQRMSAGTGVTHSEFNDSQTEPVRFLQIWIEPSERHTTPSYEQVRVPHADKRDALRRIASAEGGDGEVKIGQDAEVFASLLGAGNTVHHSLGPGRTAWLQCVEGAVEVNGVILSEGDGAGIRAEESLEITASEDAHLLLFDLAEVHG